MNRKPVATLFIDGSQENSRNVTAILNESPLFDYHVEFAGSWAEGQKRAKVRAYDLVLIDLCIPNGKGFALVKEMREICAPMTTLVVITSLDDDVMAVESLQQLADDYIVKGKVSNHDIVERVRNALIRRRATLEFKAICPENVTFDNVLSEGRMNPDLPPYSNNREEMLAASKAESDKTMETSIIRKKAAAV